MLSTFIVSILIGFTTPTANAVMTEELYHVLFVQGQILNKSTGTMLQRGDKLKPTDKLTFKSTDAKAIVLSNVRGRFMMSANPSKINSELGDVVSGLVSPLKTNSKLSTRGGEVEGETAVKDLKAHFGKAEDKLIPTYIILGDKYKFSVDKGAMKLGENEFIAMKIKTDNKNATIGLKQDNGTNTVINKESIVAKVGDVSKIEYISLHKFDKPKGAAGVDANVIASFCPVFVNTEDLKVTFKEYLGMTNVNETLATYMAGNKEALAKLPAMSDLDKKVELLFYFLSECHGKPNAEGEVNVNSIKVDYDVLKAFIKENKI